VAALSGSFHESADSFNPSFSTSRCMQGNLSYGQTLRTVGQMLEGLEIESFALKIEGNDFMVSAQKSRQPQEKSLRVSWWRLRGKSAELGDMKTPTSGVLELHYTAADIARMDSEARAKRGRTAGTPQPHALSQVLRAVGAFVDQKGGELLTVRKDDQNIEFEYRSESNVKVTQQFTVPTLYDYWVKMYLQRSGRAGPKH
jgi:hypothetical protein